MKLLFSIAGLLIAIASFATNPEIAMVDTVKLNEVTILSDYKKYQTAAKIESVPAQQVELSQAGTLDQLLSRFSPIYLKSNAGGLSTIRLRGTAPNHTSVNFGGININSLTLGHSDFSSVPVYLFDNFDLQYGSSSAVNGSGSIGGAVYLGLNDFWTDGVRVKATVSEGSFGKQLYGTKIFLGNGKFESVTRMYYFMLKNDFPFTNPVDNKTYTQRGAMIENMGLIQELKYRFNDKEWFKSALWFEHDWHHIQLLMDEVKWDNAQPETLDNKHIRFWSEYENRKQPLQYKVSLGYVSDMQLHKANKDAKIGTQRLISEVEAKQDFGKQLSYKAGAKYTYIKPNVYAYDKDVIEYEQQSEFFLSGFYMPWNPLKMTLNLRQQLVTNFNVPFTPSLGIEYRLFSNEFSIVKSTMSIGRSYRVPTFNDRFWPIVGNPDLNPEDGMNYELGLQYLYCSANFQTDLKLNAFYLDVKNWIEWYPASYGWEPFNKSRVVSKGIEMSSNTDFLVKSFHFNLRMNYSYNPTEIKDDTNAGLIGRQVLYVPKHLGTIYLNTQHKKWNISVDGTYTGERLVNYSGNIYNPDGEILDAFYLINSGLSRNMTISKQKFNLLFSVNNILNKSYYNQPGYAMWGRNFQFTFTTDLNFTKPK